MVQMMGGRVNALVAHKMIPFLSVPKTMALAAAKTMMILKWKQ